MFFKKKKIQIDSKIDYLDSEFKANFASTRSGKSKEGVGKITDASSVWWKLMGNEAAAKLTFGAHGWQAPQPGLGWAGLGWAGLGGVDLLHEPGFSAGRCSVARCLYCVKFCSACWEACGMFQDILSLKRLKCFVLV